MSLREDLIDISKKEGFRTVEEFVQFFVMKSNRTFKDLQDYLEKKYKRYYSWMWVYIYCQKMVPIYRVSKRDRVIDQSGICSPLVKLYWERKCNAIGYDSLDAAFSDWTGSLKSLSVGLGVKYPSLYSRYVKWKRKIENEK